MQCEHYQTALTESAANGVLAPELREHVANCADCRAAFTVEQSLFASVDMGIHVAANAEVPSAFLTRVQARIKEEKQPQGKYSWIPTWAFAAVTAAILLGFFFPLLKSTPRQPAQGPAIIAQHALPNPASVQNQIPKTAKTDVVVNRSLAVTADRIAPKNIAPRFAAEPEVLVPPDERQAFARFVAANKGLDAAALPKMQNENPMQVNAIEIAAIHVEPLESEQVLTDFLGRTHESE